MSDANTAKNRLSRLLLKALIGLLFMVVIWVAAIGYLTANGYRNVFLNSKGSTSAGTKASAAIQAVGS